MSPPNTTKHRHERTCEMSDAIKPTEEELEIARNLIKGAQCSDGAISYEVAVRNIAIV